MTAAEFLTLSLYIALAAVGIAQLLAMFRLVKGPNTGDRILAVTRTPDQRRTYRSAPHNTKSPKQTALTRPQSPSLASLDKCALICDTWCSTQWKKFILLS